MARRGEALRDHILWVAKDVFLEAGFERASMDQIAARAETSKRTLYAHFDNKETLYVAVVDLVGALLAARLKTPADYAGSVAEKLTTFCGRYLELLLYERANLMCRLSMAEAGRFPEGAAQYHQVVFGTPRELLSTYLKSTFRLASRASSEVADELIGRVLYPRFSRALFGLEPLYKHLDDDKFAVGFDLKPIRRAVDEVLGSLTKG
jgi:AcrR family transcriptional regulator